MQTKKNPKIAFIGKFSNMHDEEYIARSFKMIGCDVLRLPQHLKPFDLKEALVPFKPDIILYAKWECPLELKEVIESLQRNNAKTVCWLFDLYFDYQREFLVKSRSFFKSDYVFTTDGGHEEKFIELDINHKCVRQGILKEECKLLPFQSISHGIVFVGSESPIYPERTKLVESLKASWFGRYNTNEMRGKSLNELYARTRIVIGDSFPSDYYWSNRIVETLGRGGFLIHREVKGLKKEYPYLVTYKDIEDLKTKIEYYKNHEKERREIVKKNFEWVRDNYTMDKQCQKVLNYIL